MLTFNQGAADARKAVRLHGLAVACMLAKQIDAAQLGYVRGYTEALLVLVQAGVGA